MEVSFKFCILTNLPFLDFWILCVCTFCTSCTWRCARQLRCCIQWSIILWIAIHLQLFLDGTPSRGNPWSVKMTHDLSFVRWQDAWHVGEDWILSNVLHPWAHDTPSMNGLWSMCSLFALSFGFTSLHCIILLISLLNAPASINFIMKSPVSSLFSTVVVLFVLGLRPLICLTQCLRQAMALTALFPVWKLWQAV